MILLTVDRASKMPGRVEDDANNDTIKNLIPPDMITEASQFPLYEKRLKRWSRLSSSLSHQTKFDLILSSVPINNPLCEKLEEEIGDSTEAGTKGIQGSELGLL